MLADRVSCDKQARSELGPDALKLRVSRCVTLRGQVSGVRVAGDRLAGHDRGGETQEIEDA